MQKHWGHLVAIIAILSPLLCFEDFSFAAQQATITKGNSIPPSSLNEFEEEISSPTLTHSSLINRMKVEYGLKHEDSTVKVMLCAKQLAERANRAQDTQIVDDMTTVVLDDFIPKEVRFMTLNCINRPGKQSCEKLMILVNDNSQPIELRSQALIPLATARPDAEQAVGRYLTEMVLKERNPQLAASALWCFFEKDSPEAVTAILGRLNDTDQTVRLRAIAALAHPARPKPNKMERDSRIVPALIELLDDPDPLIVNAAVRGLAVLKASSAVPKFEKMLDESQKKELDDTRAIRWNIVRALGEMGDDNSSMLLGRKIMDENDDVVALQIVEAVQKRKLVKYLPQIRKRANKVQQKNQFTKQKISEVIQQMEQGE